MNAPRLDGWKAIGAYFGRDRSTVIRWAKDRGLPVHSVPGGKTRTVFAFAHELDAWARQAGSLDPADDEPAPDAAIPLPYDDLPELPADAPPPASGPARSRRRAWMLAGCTAALLLAGAAAWHWRQEASGASDALPADRTVAALYLRGREDEAERTATSVMRAIAELEEVTQRAPDYAPGFAALADAYILAREFGSLTDSAAFGKADHAASRAVDLDPHLAAAHRDLGFVAYWRDHDREGAARAFQRALALDPDDARNHFWYGNTLADNGEHEAAMREFDAARLVDPGSAAAQIDRAWAMWSAGETRQAMADLAAIAANHPNLASIHDCLSIMRLAEGDYRGYLSELRERQRLRAEPGLGAYVAQLDQAFARTDMAAVKAAVLARGMSSEQDTAFPDHSLAAFFASVSGDRAVLLRVLELADRQNEKWGAAGYVRRIAERWRGDPAIIALLGRRAAPRMEATGS